MFLFFCSTELTEGSASFTCPPASDSQKSECSDEQNKADITDKKVIISSIKPEGGICLNCSKKERK